MKVQRKVSATTILEAEGSTVAEVFEALARLENVFNGHEVCGLCKSNRTAYQIVQDTQGHKYHSVLCMACGGEFKFGMRKAPPGCLFPQYKDADGNWKPNNGWTKWEGKGE